MNGFFYGILKVIGYGLIILIGVFTSGYAQHTFFRNYSTPEGLPTSVIYRVNSDKKGFLWFSSDAGLIRYDSHKFKIYGLKEGLPDNEILELYTDPEGNLWFLTLNGQTGFLDSLGIVHLYDNLDMIRNKRVVCINKSPNGNLWMGIEPDILLQINNNKVVQSYTIPRASILSLIEDPQGKLWVFSQCSDTIYYILNQQLKKIPFKPACSNSYYPSHGKLMRDGRIGIIGVDFFSLLDPVTLKITHEISWERDNQANITDFLETANGNVYLATSSGIRQYKKEAQKYVFEGLLMNGENITGIHNDLEGNIWATSVGAGIFFIPGNTSGYYQLGEGKTANNVTALTQDKNGTLWMGSSAGHIFSLDTSGLKKIYEVNAPHKRNKLTSAFTHSNGNIWFAGDGGLLKISGKTIENYTEELAIKCLTETDNGHVYTGDFGRLMEFTPDMKKITQVSTGRTTAMTYAPGLGLFYAAYNGIFLLNESRVHTKIIAADFLQGRRVMDLHYEPSTGLLWVATSGMGLYAFLHNQVLYHFTEEDGLAGNHCNDIEACEDDLLVATKSGITYLNLKNGKPYAMFNYNSYNGLLSAEVNKILVQGDTIWAALNGGLAKVNKRIFFSQKMHPPIYIEDIKINGSSFAGKPIDNLQYFENNLSIRFTGISYYSGGALEYRYQIAELDTTWITTTASTINFNSLHPGKYTFKVIAIAPGGVESLMPAMISFTIRAAYWQTNWFKTLLGVLVFFLIIFSLMLRVRVIKRTEQEKTRLNKLLNELRLNALKAQMNPHFMFNSLGSIQNLINNNQKKDANQYLSKFAKLLRMTLDYSDAREIRVEEEIHMLQLYLELEALRFQGHFTYSIETSPNSDLYQQSIPPMLIQPFVENAIKHGLLPKKLDAALRIRFDRYQKGIFCIVEDNGIGRVAREKLKTGSDREYTSKGIAITENRLALINKTRENPATVQIIDLSDEQGNSLGTRVEIYIPFE